MPVQRFRRRELFNLAAGGLALALGADGLSRSQPRRQRGRLDLDLVAAETPISIPGAPARALTYNGLLPGPLLEMEPGDTVEIRLHNRLNQPTNLHYHGLHLPPTGQADNVFLSVAPGATQTYNFRLPEQHPAGIFYYHPHHHGTVADQVFGGLGGALIVRGALDRIPEVAGAREQVLFLKDLPSEQGGDGMGLMLGREGSILTVNGRVQPELTAQAGELLRLRIINGSNARFWRLALEGHSFHLIATDGGALAAPVQVEELLLVPGERADVLVSVNAEGGQFRLVNRPYARARGGMGMGMPMGMGMGMGFAQNAGTGPTTTIATLQTSGSQKPQTLPRRLLPVVQLPEPVKQRRFVLNHGMAPGMGMAFLINGHPYDHHRIDTRVQLGDTEEWELVNTGVMDHPFHVHVNPMQVISRNGRAEPIAAWRDVVLVRAGETVRVRIRFDDFPGRTVYHCHILDHEELGMMGTLLIEA